MLILHERVIIVCKSLTLPEASDVREHVLRFGHYPYNFHACGRLTIILLHLVRIMLDICDDDIPYIVRPVKMQTRKRKQEVS